VGLIHPLFIVLTRDGSPRTNPNKYYSERRKRKKYERTLHAGELLTQKTNGEKIKDIGEKILLKK